MAQRIVHGDLQAENIHIRVPATDASFAGFENAEFTHPTPRKTYADRIVYESQRLGFPETDGCPILCDLGEARIGTATHTGWIQPAPYRAPEVECGIPWTFSADIWNLAMVAWTLIEGGVLFSGGENEHASERHLAEIMRILGPPSKSFVDRCDDEWKEWLTKSEFSSIGGVDIPETTLQEREKRFRGEEKAGFLAFMRRMLCWVPEERTTADELLRDPWLNAAT